MTPTQGDDIVHLAEGPTQHAEPGEAGGGSARRRQAPQHLRPLHLQARRRLPQPGITERQEH